LERNELDVLGAGDPEGVTRDAAATVTGVAGRGLAKEDSAGTEIGVSAGGGEPCVAHIDAERFREKGLHASINPEMRRDRELVVMSLVVNCKSWSVWKMSKKVNIK
jgi:hypothetical protein